MDLISLRDQIGQFLHFNIPEEKVEFTITESYRQSGYMRYLIRYPSRENDLIKAYLLIPHGEGPFPGVLVHHQNAEKEHFGKSEVCGLTGESLFAFGHALANKGMVVLAPDSIGFEDRRRQKTGIIPHSEDWLERFNEMCYRMVIGDSLMKTILTDAALGISILAGLPKVDRNQIGTLGHSYGGNIVLFHTALDERVRFACSSGAAATYKNKIIKRTRLELAEVIPGFLKYFDIDDLVKCAAPRHLFLISFQEDPFSSDAPYIVEKAREAFLDANAPLNLQHRRFPGAGPTREWFKLIVDWMVACGTKEPPL